MNPVDSQPGEIMPVVSIATIKLKYGPMEVTVEPTLTGRYHWVSRYTLSKHPNPTMTGKVLTQTGKRYKTVASATKAAQKFVVSQLVRL